MATVSSIGSVDLGTAAGQLLCKLADSLPRDRSWRIAAFGSAPIQIQVDRTLISADVDVFCDEEDL